MEEMLAAGVGSFWSPARGSYGSWSCWGATFNWSVIGDNKGNEATTCQSQSGHRLVTSSKFLLIPSGVHFCWTTMAQKHKSDSLWSSGDRIASKKALRWEKQFLSIFLRFCAQSSRKYSCLYFKPPTWARGCVTLSARSTFLPRFLLFSDDFCYFSLYIYLMRLCVRLCWYFLTDVVGRLRRQRRIL